MRYFKAIQNTYIIGIGTGTGGTEISETEYNEILSVIRNRPQETAEIGYRLKTDLTWESYEKEPQSEPDVEPEEAFSILLGGDY